MFIRNFRKIQKLHFVKKNSNLRYVSMNSTYNIITNSRDISSVVVGNISWYSNSIAKHFRSRNSLTC